MGRRGGFVRVRPCAGNVYPRLVNARPFHGGPAPLATGGYRELAAIATALGLPYAGAPEIRLSRDGFEIVISLSINSGEVVGVDLYIRRDPILTGGLWPDLELRRETASDVDAKRSGMNIEVQTGDPTFDGFVYIESRFDQAVIGPMLASPEIRRVIGELIATYGAVVVQPTSMTVTTSAARRTLLEPSLFLPLLQRMLRLAHLLRPLPQGAGMRVNDRGGLLFVLSVLAFLTCWLTFFVRSHFGWPASSLASVTGLALGVVCYLVAIPLVRIYVRGHSRSRFYFRGIALSALIALPVLMTNGFVLLNAALDPSPPERMTGKVIAARSKHDDDHLADATVDWTETSASGVKTTRREQLEVKDTLQGAAPGDLVDATRHKGLFGFAWYEVQPHVIAAPRKN